MVVCCRFSVDRCVNYPCLCLCLGFALHIIKTRPLRRTTLQARQIVFTDARTFMTSSTNNKQLTTHNPSARSSCKLWVVGCRLRKLFISIYYPASCLVIRSHLNRYPISRKYANMVHSHFSCQVRKDFTLIFIELYPKKGVWQRLDNEAFLSYGFLIGHKR